MTRLVRNFALAVTAVWPAIALTTSASCGQEKDAFTDLGGRLAFSAWAAPPATEGFDLILGRWAP